jgi:hypothetical protein
MDFKNINNYLNFDKFSNSNSNNNTLENKPRLIEPGVNYFFKNILKNCNKFKQHNYNIAYNISMFILFTTVLGIILYYKYKGHRTSESAYQKNLKDKQYIMSKLVYYNRQNLDNNQKLKNNMITNLPDYSNHPEASLLHKKIYF